MSTNSNFERLTDYTRISEKDTSLTAWVDTLIPNECAIELELYQVDGLITNFIPSFLNSSNTSRGGFSLNHINGSLNTWTRIKIELSSTQAVITNLDNGTTVTRAISATDVSKIRLSTYSEISTFYFRNFKVYPI